MAIRKSTLQLKARATGSSWLKAVPHMAQPWASTWGGGSSAAISAIPTSRVRARGMRISVEIHEREEEAPQPADEVPVDGAHLQAGVPARREVASSRQDGDRGQPQHGDQHVQRVAADEHVKGASVVAAGGRQPGGQEAPPLRAPPRRE